MRMKQQGEGSVDLLLIAASWYGVKPDLQLTSAAKLLPVGNEFYGSSPEGTSGANASFFNEIPSDATLAKVSRALDDLRRLGEADLRLNHP